MFSPLCSLSLSLFVYCTNIVFTVYVYIYIVYIDNMTYVCISYPLFEIDTGKALHDGYSSILFRTEWLFDWVQVASKHNFSVAKSWVSEKSGLPMPMRSGVTCFCVKSGPSHIQRPSLSGKWKGVICDSRLGKEDYWILEAWSILVIFFFKQ